MAQIVVSYYVETLRGSAFGQRVWDNGLVENYLGTRVIKSSDGSHQQVQVTPGWYAIAQLSGAQVSAVRHAAERAHLPELPEHIAPDAALNEHTGQSAQWQVLTEAGLKTITIEHWAPVGEVQGALRALIERMGQIVITAQSGSEAVP
jgi:hypothetical protein